MTLVLRLLVMGLVVSVGSLVQRLLLLVKKVILRTVTSVLMVVLKVV